MQFISKFGLISVQMKSENRVRLYCADARVNGIKMSIEWYLCKNEAGEWGQDPKTGMMYLRRHDKHTASRNAYEKIRDDLIPRFIEFLTPEMTQLGKKIFLEGEIKCAEYEIEQLTRKIEEWRKKIENYKAEMPS